MRFVRNVMEGVLNFMNDIERIIDKFTLGKLYLYKTDRKELAKAIEQFVIKARIIDFDLVF